MTGVGGDVNGSDGAQIGDHNTQTNNFLGRERPAEWLQPHWSDGPHEVAGGKTLALRLRLSNPYAKARTVTLTCAGPGADYATVQPELTIPRGGATVTVLFTATPSDPPGGASLKLTVQVVHDERSVANVPINVSVQPTKAATVSVTGKRHADRSLISLKVANTGNAAIADLRVVATAPGAPALPLATCGPVSLGVGEAADLRIALDRQRWLAPWRPTPAVVLRTDGDDVRSGGVKVEVPPVVGGGSATAVLAAIALMLAAVVWVVWPDASAETSPETTSAAPDPGVEMVFDLPDKMAPARAPVLVDRAGRRTTLAGGGQVRKAVKVDGGWLVKRYTSTGNAFELTHLREGRPPAVLGHGDGLVFYPDEQGRRVLVDDRPPGTGDLRVTGAVRLIDLRTGHETPAQLSGAVTIVGWSGDVLLVRTREHTPDGEPRLDTWDPAKPYGSTPSAFGGSVLGTSPIVVYTGTCFIHLALTPSLEQRQRRCDPSVPLDEQALPTWWGLSPGGTVVALPGTGGQLSFVRTDKLFDGAAPVAARGLTSAVKHFAWLDERRVAVLTDGISICDVDDGTCETAPAPQVTGLQLTRLVPRLP